MVTWNQRNARVEIPNTYWNQTCGLCGTYDGDPTNDFTIPGKHLVSIIQYHENT